VHAELSESIGLEALRGSFLAALPAPVLEQVLAGAIRLDVPAGAVVYREGDAARTGLVLKGLIRVYLTSTEGRQVTVRYVRRGEVIGAPVAVAGPVRVSVQALTDSSVLVMNVGPLQALGQTDARFAWALAEEIAQRLYEVLEAFAGNAFGSVRQRVARHLLDLAAQHQRDAKLVAPVSQQELADTVGSVREVVTRVLREMRDAGLVQTVKQGIVLIDPDGLHREADDSRSR
jgi:CRP/FNR family transcriptional regulator, cyclic AMP receptor protein